MNVSVSANHLNNVLENSSQTYYSFVSVKVQNITSVNFYSSEVYLLLIILLFKPIMLNYNNPDSSFLWVFVEKSDSAVCSV